MNKKQFIFLLAGALIMTLFVDYIFALIIIGVPLAFNVLGNPALAEQSNFIKDFLLNPIHLISESMKNDIFVKAQLVFLVLFLFLIAKKIIQNRKHKVEDASDYAAYGSARYATDKEIRQNIDFDFGFETDGTILGFHQDEILVHQMKSWLNRNIALFGGSGSQKTKSHIIPNILNTSNDSIVVTDPKGELYRDTADIKRKQGYQVHVLNFKNPTLGDHINPLDCYGVETDALKIGKALVANANGGTGAESKFWEDNEAILISSAILYVKSFLPHEQQHLGSVFNILNCSLEELIKLYEPIDVRHIAKRKFKQFLSYDDKTRSIIWGSTKSALDLWTYDSICEMTSRSDFNIQDIGKKKTILYIIVPSADETFRPLSSTLFYLLFDQLMLEAEKYPEIALPVPVRFLIDEFSNIGKIPMFDERLSVVRSYKIYVTMVIQSLSQLEKHWGENGRKEIMDNCDIRLFMGTNDPDSAEFFSKMIGITTKRIKGDSETESEKGKSTGESYTYVQRSVETPDELLRYDGDSMIVFTKGEFPIKLKKPYYDKIPEINELMHTAERNILADYQRKVTNFETFLPYGLEPEVTEETKKSEEVAEDKETKKEEAVPYWD